MAKYEVRESDSPIDDGNFDQGDPVPTGRRSPWTRDRPRRSPSAGSSSATSRFAAWTSRGTSGRRRRSRPRAREAAAVRRRRRGPKRITSIARKALKRSKPGLTFRGRSFDVGCHTALQATNAILVSITVRKRIGGKCRFLQRDGTFTKKQSCKQPIRIRTHGKYSLATRTVSWSYRPHGKLPAGTYMVNARGVDQSGNVEQTATSRNRRTFRSEEPGRVAPHCDSALHDQAEQPVHHPLVDGGHRQVAVHPDVARARAPDPHQARLAVPAQEDPRVEPVLRG